MDVPDDKPMLCPVCELSTLDVIRKVHNKNRSAEDIDWIKHITYLCPTCKHVFRDNFDGEALECKGKMRG